MKSANDPRPQCPRCGLHLVQDNETGEWVCAYCGFVSSRRPKDPPVGANFPKGPDLVKRLQLLNQVSQQFGRDKVDELLKDDPALREAWDLQLLNEVSEQFGKDKADRMISDKPGLKERWEDLSRSPEYSPLSARDARPGRIWYLVPLFFSILGGIVAYIVVKDRDESMAGGCLVLGFLVFLFELVLLFVY